MHSILSVAGILALIAFAFGEHAAARVAQAIIMLAVSLILLLALDILAHGALSSLI